MVATVIIEYLVFVFMVVASVGIAHLGLKLVELLDAYFSTDPGRSDNARQLVAGPRSGKG